MSKRRATAAIVGALTACVIVLCGASTASAVQAVDVTPNVPPAVALGEAVPATITITNLSTPPEDVVADVTQITLIPNCGALSEVCPPTAFDPGVLVPRPTGTGRAGTLCAGTSFSITLVNAAEDRYGFAPSQTVLLDANESCIIDFTLDVAKLPTQDAAPATDGLQTVQYAMANLGGETFGTGIDMTTVTKATPSIVPQASPQTILLGATFTGAAIVNSAVPPTGSVRFDVFGPGDAACFGPPALTSTNPLEAMNATSNAFMPAVAGTYRVIATYLGDASNEAAGSACADPAALVTVNAPAAAAPPPPPPPPPAIVPEPPASSTTILRTAFSSPPRVGTTTNLVVRASDRTLPISGIEVSFGESRGLSGVSACRVRSLGASIAPVTLRIPYVFRTPGTHTITIVVLAGDCTGELTRTETTIVITVAPRASARASGAQEPAARPAAARRGACKDPMLVPTATNRRRIAAAVMCLVNAERRKRGRKALRPSPRLQRAANAHSSDMFKRRYFEHERAPGGPKLAARLRKAGYRGPTYAENIAYGADYTPMLVVRAWMNSPGHRANILHPRLRFAGVGMAFGIPVTPQKPGTTFTHNFGGTLK